MRILIAANSYPTKKNPTRQGFIKNLYDGLNKEIGTVDIVHNQYYKFFKSDLESGNPFISGVKILFMVFTFLPYILYKARAYDIIYSQSAILPGFLVMLASKLHQTQYISYVHGSENNYIFNKGLLFNLTKKVLHNSEKVITNSHYMKERINTHYQCECIVISPGFNKKMFSYQRSKKTIDIFFAGHAIRRKGIDILLQAINYDKEFYKVNNISVHIHCAGGSKNEYLAYAKKHKLTEFITFGDRLSESELAKYYKLSKIVVFPSRTEPLGLVGIEAISSGAFLIATNTGGIKEYVKHGINGYLFEKNNPVDLQNFIRKAYNNYTSIEEKLEENSRTVEKYSLKYTINQTMKLLHETLKNNSGLQV